MGYDLGDSFIFDFEPNGIQFGSRSKGKRSPGSYPIQVERKWKYSFLSVTPTITCTAVQEIEFSRPNVKPLGHHSTMVSKGVRGALNWVPIMPRGVSLSTTAEVIFCRPRLGQTVRYIVDVHTQKIFQILLHQTEIRLYLPLFNHFLFNIRLVFQNNRYMVNTI